MPARPSLERFSLDLKGVEFRPMSRVHELIASSGAVTRVRYRTMAMGTAVRLFWSQLVRWPGPSR